MPVGSAGYFGVKSGQIRKIGVSKIVVDVHSVFNGELSGMTEYVMLFECAETMDSPRQDR
jgi:hypothetical protein